MFISGITFGIFNRKLRSTSRRLSEFAVEMDTIVEYNQSEAIENGKTTLTKVVHSEIVESDTESMERV